MSRYSIKAQDRSCDHPGPKEYIILDASPAGCGCLDVVIQAEGQAHLICNALNMQEDQHCNLKDAD